MIGGHSQKKTAIHSPAGEKARKLVIKLVFSCPYGDAGGMQRFYSTRRPTIRFAQKRIVGRRVSTLEPYRSSVGIRDERKRSSLIEV